VLDFVGRHRAEFRFDRKLVALLGVRRRDLERQVAAGFPFLPAGCHLELDPVAADIVLDNLRTAIPAKWTERVAELRSLAATGRPARLRDLLDESGLEVDDIYAGGRSWSELREAAGLPVLERGPNEDALRRACGRLLHMDDRERLDEFRELLASETPPALERFSERRRRLVRMLVASLMGQVVDKSTPLDAACTRLWRHPQVRSELSELFDVLASRIDHIHERLEGHPDAPLQVHARYTRIEIFAAFGVGAGARVAPWQSGVHFAPEAAADLFAFTLDKTTGEFSPTTRYRDYALSRELVHWESQSATRAQSETGRRYQEHVARGTSVMLFARLRSDDRAFWFLGPATYVRHESERPMAVTWRLRHPLPGDLFASFAAAVA
jgi:hypothetical protein